MSDTFFTASPHWGWYIVLYFFVGGIAGGAMFLAGCLRLFGRPEDRPMVHLGHYLAAGGAVLSGLLLTVDLTRPDRFWRMLTAFKTASPMSVGAWAVLLFGLVAAMAALGSMTDERRLAWRPAAVFSGGTAGRLVAGLGGLLGLFLAGYTGVLLSVTNRPLWADSSWLGVLFLFSGLSTGAAALLVIGRRRSLSAGTLDWLTRFDRRILVGETIALVVFVASLGPASKPLGGVWGLLWLGAAVIGIALPLVLESRRRVRYSRVAPALVLAGGFLLRAAVIFASSAIEPVGARIAGG